MVVNPRDAAGLAKPENEEGKSPARIAEETNLVPSPLKYCAEVAVLLILIPLPVSIFISPATCNFCNGLVVVPIPTLPSSKMLLLPSVLPSGVHFVRKFKVPLPAIILAEEMVSPGERLPFKSVITKRLPLPVSV